MKQIIYDIGMHTGDDAKYYLEKGFRVIAVEANKILCDRATVRFSRWIHAGDLVILNIGISAKAGISNFWICEDNSEWSSFDRKTASRGGSRHHSVDVSCNTVEGIVDQYGIALYMKIDVEGNERVCLETMRVDQYPKYLSIEVNEDVLENIPILSGMGYERFKIICQNPECWWLDFNKYNSLVYSSGASSLGNSFIKRIYRRLATLKYKDDISYFGNSGPFGEMTCGKWWTYRQTRDLCTALLEVIGPSVWESEWWFDIHAAR